MEPISPQRRAAADLAPAVARLLARNAIAAAGIDVIAFSQGPGSFTGLRIGATFVRMMQAGIGCQVVLVPTIEALALTALAGQPAGTRVIVLMDGQRELIYSGMYELDRAANLLTLEPPALRDPIEWASMTPGSVLWAASVTTPLPGGAGIAAARQHEPSVAAVLALGRRLADAGTFCLAQKIVPFYVRAPECEEVFDARRAAAKERRSKT